MSAVSAEQLAGAAERMFNALSKQHNKVIDELVNEGIPISAVAIASYVALRVAISRSEDIAQKLIQPDGWPAVETVIRVMRELVTPATATDGNKWKS